MITEEYIMKLVEKFAKSSLGKAAIKKQTGIVYTDKEPTGVLMKYGTRMKNILYQHISAYIKSITLDDLKIQEPYKGSDGRWRLEISFREGSLKRQSLDKDNYPDGLENIVLLFVKGYSASNYVYGTYGDHGRIRSRKAREGSDFLIQAINEFNSEVEKGIATSKLLGDYK